MRSRVEHKEWCVMLKMVTEIRRNNASDNIYIYSRMSLSCTEFIVRLEARGGIETTK